ncbi:UL-16 binding protein 5-like isoform X2 [Myotis yumanensis]|uniref:UL-16 binding protein 5-like isoform X2 n=1 Tax=Myotis yumanensis TaxID=159337 RepID=UPI0038D1627B
MRRETEVAPRDLRNGAPSLGYKFTVTPNGQPWCEIQGQVNGNTFLHYTCGGNKVRLISVLDVNATQAWSEQRDALQYVVEELKKTLLDIRAEIPATRGPLSLQGSMMCEQESNVLTAASCEFGLDGRISLHFDSKNGHWTVLLGEGRLLKQTLASDRAMTDLLVRTSTGDCRKWLQQVLCPRSTQDLFLVLVPLLSIMCLHLTCSTSGNPLTPPHTSPARILCHLPQLHQPLPQPQSRPRPQPTRPSLRSSL